MSFQQPNRRDSTSRLRGLLTLAALLLGTGSALAHEPAPPIVQPGLSPVAWRQTEERYLTRQFSFQNVEAATLTRWLGRLGIDLPFTLDGRLTSTLTLGVPVRGWRNPKAYRIDATLNSPELKVEGIALNDLHTRFRYRDGVLHLDELDFNVPDQTKGKPPLAAGAPHMFSGKGALPLMPLGNLTLDASFNSLPLARLAAAFPDALPVQGGRLSGRVSAGVPAEKISDLSAWNVRGRVRIKDLKAWDYTVQSAGAAFSMAGGVLHLTDLETMAYGGLLKAKGSLRLSQPFAFRADYQLEIKDLNRFAAQFDRVEAVRSVSGKLQFDGQANGTLEPLQLDGTLNALADSVKARLTGMEQPLTIDGRLRAAAHLQRNRETKKWQARGTLSLAEFRAANLLVESLATKWSIDGDTAQATELAARLYGGELRGSAEVSVSGENDTRASLQWESVDAASLLADVSRFPIDAHGKADGKAELKWPADPDDKGNWELTASTTLPSITIADVDIGDLRADLEYRSKSLAYSAAGTLLDGKISLEGEWPGLNGREPAPTDSGRLRWSGAHLGRLLPEAALPAERRLDAQIDVKLDYRHAPPPDQPVGDGSISLIGLRLGKHRLAERLDGQVSVTADKIAALAVSGGFAGGTLGLQARVPLTGPRRFFDNQLQFSLRRADASEILFWAPELSSQIKGDVDLNLRGRFDGRLVLGGRVAANRLRVGDLRVGSMSMPLQVRLSAATGHAEIDLRNVSGRLAGGRISGRLQLTQRDRRRLEGEFRFNNVNLHQVLKESFGTKGFGQSRVRGTVRLSGRNVRQPSDVTAVIDARLRSVRPAGVPVVSAIQPYLPARIPASAIADEGVLKARLAGGQLRIEQFSLTDESLQVYIRGTVSSRRRMNLDAMVHIGAGGSDRMLARLLLARLPALAPTPLAVLLQVNNFLSDRVVHLDVTGRIEKPVVRIRPEPLLTDAAIRYFLGQIAQPN